MKHKSLYEHVAANKFKSSLLLGVFAAIVMGAGFVWGEYYGDGMTGLMVAGIFTVIYGLIAYFKGSSIALAVSGAKKADKRNYNELYSAVDNLAITAGLPTPEVYVMESEALNAFATGRDPKHSAIAVTTGLLATLTKRELRGVLAHEMSHIGNYDIRMQTLVIILAGALTMMADLFMRATFYGNRGGSRGKSGGKAGGIIIIIAIGFAILSPLIATLIQMTISRKREFLADHTGAIMIQDAEALASALEKIGGDTHQLKTANKATAHLFISNPLKKGVVANLFSTHPPIEERVKILREF